MPEVHGRGWVDYVQMLGCLIHGTRVPADPGGGELEKNPQKGTQAVSPPFLSIHSHLLRDKGGFRQV